MRLTVVSALGILLIACSKSPPPPPPPTAVVAIKVAARPVEITEDYVAQTEAVNTVEIRPRVGGLLEKQMTPDGSHVKHGQVLFIIDQQPFITALAQAKAQLAEAQASLQQAERDLSRVRPLSSIDAVSQQELDAAIAKYDAGKASVAAGEAAMRTAELNLGYTTLTSPIDGVMGQAQLRVGSLVNANSTLLSTVYTIDPMYVSFAVSEQRLLEWESEHGSAAIEHVTGPLPFRTFLADGSAYPYPAKLNFVDAAVDQRTGTLRMRVSVPNPKEMLRAGQFARVQFVSRTVPNGIVVPQRAVQELQGKTYVWIVDDASKAQQRDVTMGPRVGSDWLVQKGIAAGDVVITDGAQRLKPGAPVRVQMTEPQPASSTPPATPSAGDKT
jgi:membrane fusion protein (multidrug efflux system)